MTRPHFHRSIRNGAGDLRTQAQVDLLVPGTSTPFPQTVYYSGAGPTEKGASWVATTGIVDFYLELPAIVDILITPAGGGTPVRFSDQWVGDAENLLPEGLSMEGALAGQVPISDGSGSWSWGPVGGGVTSVNGSTGDVILTAESIGAVPATSEIDSVSVLTRTAYDALSPKNPLTLYVISGA